MEPRRRTLKPAEAVEQALKLARAVLPRNVVLEQNIEGGQDPMLADASQLHQVVMNLCVNAAQAMAEHGGLLRVSLTDVQIDQWSAASVLGPGRYLELKVRDQGHGMDDETLAKIFDPFFTTKAPGEGTGLGLSLVHGIVQAHGGEIIVQSEVGAGTCFQVFLPHREGLPSVEAAPEAQQPVATGHALVVDDEPVITRAIARTLRRAGFTVSVHVQSSEALAEFERSPGDFSLLVTDLSMPGMSGLELTQRVRAIQPGLPTLLVSGRMLDELDRAEGLFDGLLMKPFDARDLLVALRGALARSGRDRPRAVDQVS